MVQQVTIRDNTDRTQVVMISLHNHDPVNPFFEQQMGDMLDPVIRLHGDHLPAHKSINRLERPFIAGYGGSQKVCPGDYSRQVTLRILDNQTADIFGNHHPGCFQEGGVVVTCNCAKALGLKYGQIIQFDLQANNLSLLYQYSIEVYPCQ